ncbi:hypothetical protein A2U01_0044310, partial [Trifolium medium]|nr:hypothetical protein [Trifolium medium]
PLERVLVNSIDELEEEWDREIEICLRQLESSRVDESPKVEELILNVQEKECLGESRARGVEERRDDGGLQ